MKTKFYRTHAIPLTIVRKHRERFPSRSRGEWFVNNDVSSHAPFRTGSGTVRPSFTNRYRLISQSAPQSFPFGSQIIAEFGAAHSLLIGAPDNSRRQFGTVLVSSSCQRVRFPVRESFTTAANHFLPDL